MTLRPAIYVFLFCTCIVPITILAAVSPSFASWKTNPEITLAAAEDDQRIEAVFEAVDYWNTSLRQLDIPLQLGPVRFISPPDIEESLKIMSARDLAGADRLPYPSFMDTIDTEILIVLTSAEFVSFAEYWEKHDKAIVAIKSDRTPPLSLPNVTQNVIAHELGHILGLDHNGAAAMLMCGRPAPCRPDRFSSASPRFLPLTEAEKKRLRDTFKTYLPGNVQGMRGDE